MFHAGRRYSPVMQAAVEPSSTSSSFAGVLAALTRTRTELFSKWEGDLERDLDGDPDRDVATLSYERALLAHARYQPSAEQVREDSATRNSSAVAAVFQPESTPESAPESKLESGIDAARRAPDEQPAAQPAAQLAEAVARRTATALEEKRMRASVTVRMSNAEFAQLQQRAAEAGLTVSAYLRSCTFEVETLRAQVKQALAELRTARAQPAAQPRASRLARTLARMRIYRLATA